MKGVETPFFICNMKISFHTPDDAEIQLVKKHIAEFKLDDTDLRKEQFIVVSNENGLVGFGRLRKYEGITELCTLGIIPAMQKRSLGKELVTELLSKAEKPVYVVCVIPDFFEKCGFKLVNDFPDAIKNKLNFCVDKWSGWKREDYKVLKFDI